MNRFNGLKEIETLKMVLVYINKKPTAEAVGYKRKIISAPN
jgi:hypothetical protein